MDFETKIRFSEAGFRYEERPDSYFSIVIFTSSSDPLRHAANTVAAAPRFRPTLSLLSQMKSVP
jgi:hypothetical protein